MHRPQFIPIFPTVIRIPFLFFFFIFFLFFFAFSALSGPTITLSCLPVAQDEDEISFFFEPNGLYSFFDHNSALSKHKTSKKNGSRNGACKSLMTLKGLGAYLASGFRAWYICKML